MPDLDQYVGIPFRDKGRAQTCQEAHERGVDCWGLVQLVEREQFRVSLPSYVEEYEHVKDSKTIDSIMCREIERQTLVWKEWRQVDHPQIGDVVIFRIGEEKTHAGVAVNDKSFLHIRGDHAMVQDFTSPEWKLRTIGHYRHVT